MCTKQSYLQPPQTFKDANVTALRFFLPLCEVHDQKYSGREEHIDLSVFQMQTGPDKVVITVRGVYTIT